MKVVVTVEARLQSTPDGRVWCDNQFNFPYAFWQRYLTTFDGVIVAARVATVKSAESHWREVTGAGVSVHALPFYIGPWMYLRSWLRIRQSIHSLVRNDCAYILRVPSTLADSLVVELKKRSLAYGVEVVGDPWEVFGPGVFKHFLRPFFRLWFTYQLKRVCAGAAASSYVTERALQARYPSPLAKVSIAASSIELKEEAIAAAPRKYTHATQLVFVGTLEQHQKGVDVLLDALVFLPDVRLTILGDGRVRSELEAQADRLGLLARVQFLGAVPAGEEVRRALDAADIFVLPSRGEGLPRAMIEAMARGLFCIGTQIGGTQELLRPEWCVPVNRPDLLAARLRDAMVNPELMTSVAAENWQKAKNYHHDILTERRCRFYSSLLKSRSPHGKL